MRRLVVDALFAEAHAKMTEILRLMDDIDAIGGELHHHGYYQFPDLDFLFGNSCIDDACEPIESADFILDMAEQDPKPPSAHYVECARRREQNSASDRTPVGQEVIKVFKLKRHALSKKFREDIGIAAGWRCCYCGKSSGTEKGPDGRCWHIDHSYPFVRGGDNGKDNLILACATCNLEKHAMSTLEFLRSRSGDDRPARRLDETDLVLEKVVTEVLQSE